MNKNSIREKLLELGFSPASKGFECIVDAVCIMTDENNKLRNITKSVYPDVGVKHGITSHAVERNVRSSIKSAMSVCPEKIEDFVRLPPTSVSGSYKNSDFLAAFCMAMKRE